MDFLGSLIESLGGWSGLGAFGILFLVVVGAAWVATLRKNDNGLTGRIMHLAGVAVLAVEKLTDNGQYEGLTQEQKNNKRKSDALSVIEQGLIADGFKPNRTLMSFAGYAIEFALHRMNGTNVDAEALPVPPLEMPPQ